MKLGPAPMGLKVASIWLKGCTPVFLASHVDVSSCLSFTRTPTSPKKRATSWTNSL
jgi:hypothetical protein